MCLQRWRCTCHSLQRPHFAPRFRGWTDSLDPRYFEQSRAPIRDHRSQDHRHQLIILEDLPH